MGFIYGIKVKYYRHLPKTNFPTSWLSDQSAMYSLTAYHKTDPSWTNGEAVIFGIETRYISRPIAQVTNHIMEVFL